MLNVRESLGEHDGAFLERRDERRRLMSEHVGDHRSDLARDSPDYRFHPLYGPHCPSCENVSAIQTIRGPRQSRAPSKGTHLREGPVRRLDRPAGSSSVRAPKQRHRPMCQREVPRRQTDRLQHAQTSRTLVKSPVPVIWMYRSVLMKSVNAAVLHQELIPMRCVRG